MKFITLFTNEFGRETYQQTDDPARTLAIRVAEGKMTAKQAAAAVVLSTEQFKLQAAELTKAIEFQRAVEQARVNPEALREALMRKKVDEAYVEQIRAELQSQEPWNAERFALPWPFVNEREEAVG